MTLNAWTLGDILHQIEKRKDQDKFVEAIQALRLSLDDLVLVEATERRRLETE